MNMMNTRIWPQLVLLEEKKSFLIINHRIFFKSYFLVIDVHGVTIQGMGSTIKLWVGDPCPNLQGETHFIFINKGF